MPNRVIGKLYRTKKSIEDVLEELGLSDIDISDVYTKIEECSHCGFWKYKRELKPDLDGFPICDVCREFYGD
jgi:hypothetical protein